MSEDQREEVVEPTTEETPPQEEQATQEEIEDIQPEDNPDEIEGEEESPSNAAFAKLRAENKRLKELAEQTQVDSEYLNSLKSVAKPWESPDYRMPQFNPGINDNTTYDQLNQQMAQLQQQAYQATQEAERTRMEMEETMAKQKYPDLFADKEAEQIMAEKLITAKVTGQRKSVMQIAEETARIFQRRQEAMQVEANQQAKARVETKRTADVQTPGTATPPSHQAQENEDAIRNQIRRGNMEATESYLKDRVLKNMDF